MDKCATATFTVHLLIVSIYMVPAERLVVLEPGIAGAAGQRCGGQGDERQFIYGFHFIRPRESVVLLPDNPYKNN